MKEGVFRPLKSRYHVPICKLLRSWFARKPRHGPHSSDEHVNAPWMRVPRWGAVLARTPLDSIYEE